MKTLDVSPNPNALIFSMRSLGYDIKMAIADLIDNSISANAKRIDVIFYWNGSESIIAIKDNGNGMSEDELANNLRLGSSSPEDVRDINDMGRFGLGLKAASFSQCRLLTVVSKKRTYNEAVMIWDLDYVKQQNKWLVKVANMNVYEAITGRVDESGTIVVWDKLDKSLFRELSSVERPESRFLEIAEQINNHIGVTYHEYSNDIEFYINNHRVKMWDPFLSVNKSTRVFPEEMFTTRGVRATVTAYVLPYIDYMSAEEINLVNGDSTWQNLQGFYIYRNRRLIVKADWLLPKLDKKLSTKHARIKIELDNTCDELWNIDLKKSKVVPPMSLIKDLNRIAKFTREESEKIYKHKGKVVSQALSGRKEYVWDTISKDGKFTYKINRDHPNIKRIIMENDSDDIRKLISLIESTMPIHQIIANQQDKDISQDEVNTLSEKDLLKLAYDASKAFAVQGMSKSEILSMLRLVQPFNEHIEIIDELEKNL